MVIGGESWGAWITEGAIAPFAKFTNDIISGAGTVSPQQMYAIAENVVAEVTEQMSSLGQDIDDIMITSPYGVQRNIYGVMTSETAETAEKGKQLEKLRSAEEAASPNSVIVLTIIIVSATIV